MAEPTARARRRKSSSSSSPLKSIPEAASNGASEINVVENDRALDISSPPDNSVAGAKSTEAAESSSSKATLGVAMPAGLAARSASLQPPNESEDETEISLFNRRQSGK